MPKAAANGIELEYETFGDPGHPPILLIMGLASQLIHWPEPFCERLAQAGYYVIRFDNRDIGLSTRLSGQGKVKLMRQAIKAALGLRVRAPYLLEDMAQDALGLLDALKIESAHIVGASMGGMIGQILAAKHPQRVKSFVCWMSSSGNPLLRGPSLKIRLRLVSRPSKLDRESLIQHSMQTWRLIGSPRFPTDPGTLRARIERAFDRAHYPPGLARQTLAIIASPSRVPLLKKIKAPTLVLHGQDDALVPVAAAHDLAKHIPGARLEIIRGYGHDLPAQLLPRLAELVLEHLRSAALRQAA